MRNVFKNNDLQAKFDKQGYVIVPFLEAREVDELKQAYFDTLDQSGGKMLGEDTDFGTDDPISYDFTFIDKSIAYKKLVFELITQKFMPVADRYLDHYQPIIANYIRKKENDGEVPLHQNWAFADEEKYASVSVWCPLVDSNSSNGTLQVVEGSHQRFGRFRGPMVPWELEGIKKEIIDNHLIPLEVKAGEAVILDDSIVHYSNINQTDGLRLAIQLILIPAETPSIHYHMNPREDAATIHVMEVDQEFYMQFNPWLKPSGTKTVKAIDFEYKPVTETEFLARIKGPTFAQMAQKGLLTKVKHWLFSN